MKIQVGAYVIESNGRCYEVYKPVRPGKDAKRQDLVTFDEVKQLRRLLAKAEGKRQGHRTDLYGPKKKKRKKESTSPLGEDTLLNESKPLERIVVEPVDEFAQMKDKLGISNRPKPAHSGYDN